MTFDQWLIARLKAFGVYTAANDGGYGRAVINALEQFQKDRDLPVTGTANTATVYALRQDPKSEITIYQSVPVNREPPWMREAMRLKGLREIPGAKSNATIMGWAKTFGGWISAYYTNDDIPWCGLFQGHLFGLTLPSEILPSNPLSARAWSKFGVALKVPSLGALMTFTRKGGGHVGLYVGEDASHFHILGGNQSNSITVTRIEKKRLDAIRWPTTAEPPIGGRITLTAGGALVSTNEQ